MGKFFRGAGESGGSAKGTESGLVSALGEICRRWGKDISEITWSQYLLYLEALGEERLRELRERAIAARMAMATAESWQDFMAAVDGDDGADKEAVDRLAQIEQSVSTSNISEGEIEWLKSG